MREVLAAGELTPVLQGEIRRGTSWVFLAEALAVPAGLLIAGLLSRVLGPASYGRYGLAISILTAAQWVIVGGFTRISTVLLSDPRTRDRMEPSVLRAYLFSGLALLAVLASGAGFIAGLLHAPDLASDLRLALLDLPLFAMTQAQRNILIGTGEYSGRAASIAARWVCRVVVTWALVLGGYGVTGAILAWPAASIAELAVLRRISLRRLFEWPETPPEAWKGAWSAFAFSAGQRVFERSDLMLLQLFGTASASLALYVAAQNLSVLPGLLAGSISPVLIASLTRERALGNAASSDAAAKHTLRTILCLLPLAAVFAACGRDVAALAFGEKFRGAGSLIGWLMAGYMGMTLTSTVSAIYSAHGRHAVGAAFTLPSAACAVLIHFVLIPHYGMQGAAIVTSSLGLVTGLAAVAFAHREWGEPFPAGTLLRASLASAMVLLLGQSVFLSEVWLVARLGLMGVTGIGMVLLLGEWRPLVRQPAA